MQESEVTFSLAMKNEKEIYLMSEKQDDDDKVTYLVCRLVKSDKETRE